MGVLVHFYSTADGTADEISGPSVTGPRRAAATGAISHEIVDFNAFYMWLDTFKRDGLVIDRMVIETHGSPGAIYLGKDMCNSTSILSLNGRGYELMFSADARIFLNGCNIAETECTTGTCGPAGNGRKFLFDVATVFLRLNGGRVGACTSKGLPFFNSKVYHLWGRNVYAIIGRNSTNRRLVAGDELTKPDGLWTVTLADKSEYSYVFNEDGSVRWSSNKLFGGGSGRGRWELTAGALTIRWESGGSEVWPAPLYSEEQSGVSTAAGGATSDISAEKVVTGRWTD